MNCVLCRHMTFGGFFSRSLPYWAWEWNPIFQVLILEMKLLLAFFESGDGDLADRPSGSPDLVPVLAQRNPHGSGGSAASDSPKAGGGSGARSRSRWNWRLEWTRWGGLAVKPKTGMSLASGMSIGFQTRTWWNSSAWFQSKRLLQRRKKTGPLQLNLFVSWIWINHSEFDKMRNHPN